MSKILNSIFGAVWDGLFKGVEDKYAVVAPSKPRAADAREVPTSLRESDIPDFGSDHEKMLEMAVKNYPTLELQIKWLKSMHKVRFGTDHGWIGEINAAVKPDPRYEVLGYGKSYSDPRFEINPEILIDQVQQTRLVLPADGSYKASCPAVKGGLTLVR